MTATKSTKFDATKTYVLTIADEGTFVFGPHADTDATIDLVQLCKAAESMDDMPTVDTDEADAVCSAFAVATDRDCLHPECVAVCRVE